MLSVAASAFCAYTLAPGGYAATATRSGPLSMEEHRLNNYVLDGPLQPLGNQVIIKLRRLDETTTGGLFLATSDEEKKKPKEGLVVGAGPGKYHSETGALLPCSVKEGELVLLSDFTGEKVDYDGEQHVLVDADSLLGSFENKQITADAFRPMGDNVLIAKAEAVSETTTGIALAGQDEEDGNQGEVVAVGAGAMLPSGERRPVCISPGESVMYKPYCGSDATFDGKEFKVVSEAECLAKW